MLEDEEIRDILSGPGELAQKAQRLIEAANAHGGKDNIAIILIEPLA